jgi:hypothetical protein
MVAVPVAPAVVLTVNVAVEALAGTVTLAGTVALALLLPRVTTAPPAGAIPVKVIVPVDELPDITDDGFNDREVTVGALIVSEPVVLTLL